MKRAFLLFVLVVFSPMTGHSAPAMQEMSLKVTTDFVLPAYEKFAKEASSQAKVASQTCNKEDLKKAYQKTADAWAAVQHINFGPITLLLRRDRLYHWPERRNAVAKGLNKLLSTKNDSLLETDKFTNTSVAVQGLPALERILYTDMFEDEYSCRIAKAIALNIAEIANGAITDWNKTLVNIQEGKAHPFYFENMDEVAIRLFTEMLTGFQMISDQKLALPMGSSLKKANGKRAEAWRSNRSTRYIQQNSLALMAMAKPFMTFLPDDVTKEVQVRFFNFSTAANNLPLSIKDAVKNEGERAKLSKFSEEIKVTRNLLVETFTKHLGLTVGFNSLDGD